MAPKTIAEKYKKHELRDHIYDLPDTYCGSSEPQTIETYLYDDASKTMMKREITFVPALFKCFDEVLVNALDHATRLKTEAASGKTDVKHVKNIKVNIDKTTGEIAVYNDGDGLDVEKHPEHDMYVPELVFGNLLTSANYDKEEDKVVGGKNGVGAKLTNIFSHEFVVETADQRLGKSYKQKWTNNMKKRENPTVRASSKAPFTRITWKPDYERFGMTGITDDLFDLFRRRTMDAGACTDANVAVYFNDVKLEYKDFEHFVDLFIGTKSERPRAYEVCAANGRLWEIIATYSDGGSFEQVSFVNGINTLRGGKHVDHVVSQVAKKMNEVMAKKKKDIKPQHIRDNLWVFVKATIVNPTFDSQTKETLTTQSSKFGSKCELSDKFMLKLFQTGLIDRVTAITEFHDKKKLSKTDGKKTNRVIVPKLDDANKAGTKDSAACTLILTEGDSAKTMAIAGLSVVGRDHYGVFPLKGKILNVKDAQAKKIAENEEIANLKKILGLEQGKTYQDVGALRYGRIMIMTDQDVDGYHIRGLLFNVFQSMWPSLFKMDNFLTSMRTPIVKASHRVTGQVVSFYNVQELEAWKVKREVEANGLRGWTFKYYKGLGTSTAAEAKEYFKTLNITFYKHNGKASEDSMDLAFNKKRADDRKTWLLEYDPQRTLDYTKKEIPYSEFVHDELIHFSNRDLERSIPSLIDGLKESQRKIMFGCLKKKLYTREIRVAQLSGYISEVAVYHHGEASLQQAIIKMAQDFVGANNINLLMPNGQFGTRIQGGMDAASPRYIHTLLSPLARLIFREEDNNVLKYMNDDGTPIEPEYYVPVIPMVLVNGGLGIGTGFSTNIPCHNPTDVIAMCAMLIASLDVAGVRIETRANIAEAFQIMENAVVEESTPWYLGFVGTITAKNETSYVSKGVWKWLDETTLEITELPIGTWTEDYKEMLTTMVSNGNALLKDFENHYTDKKVRFILKFYPGKLREASNAVLETEFKLASTANMSMNNLHLYNAKGAIQRFKRTADIVKAWARVRLTTYYDRKENQLKVMEADFKMLSAKVRFIQDFIAKKIDVMNKKEREVDEQLVKLGYPKLNELVSAVALTTEETEEAAGPAAPTIIAANYRYLTNMPIRQLTFEEKNKLENEARVLQERIETLREMQIHHIWRRELEELRSAWEAYKSEMESGYTDAGNAAAAAPAKKRRAAPKK